MNGTTDGPKLQNFFPQSKPFPSGKEKQRRTHRKSKSKSNNTKEHKKANPPTQEERDQHETKKCSHKLQQRWKGSRFWAVGKEWQWPWGGWQTNEQQAQCPVRSHGARARAAQERPGSECSAARLCRVGGRLVGRRADLPAGCRVAPTVVTGRRGHVVHVRPIKILTPITNIDNSKDSLFCFILIILFIIIIILLFYFCYSNSLIINILNNTLSQFKNLQKWNTNKIICKAQLANDTNEPQESPQTLVLPTGCKTHQLGGGGDAKWKQKMRWGVPNHSVE